MKQKCTNQIRTITAFLLVVVWTLASEWATSDANATSKDERPNIVFIEVDDLTYSYLGCMGNKLVRTPNIDSLAKRGVLFKNAVCQGMMCGPSRNSLMTGLCP